MDKEKIRKALKKKSKRWDEESLNGLFKILEDLEIGELDKTSYFFPETTYEQYIQLLNL